VFFIYEFLTAATNERMHATNRYAINCLRRSAWSRRLWKVQSDRLGVLVLALSVSYMAIGYYVLAHRDGKEALDGVYFLSATLSTVGYGDLAPVKQGTRGASVVLIPFGLFIIGFALSWSRARAKAAAPKVSFETKMRAVDDAGGDGDGVLTASELLRATTGSAFIDDGSGGGGGGGLQDGLTKMVELVESTLFFKSLVLVLQLAATATIGAVFFKLYRPEARELELSWIEAYYFAIVTSTSIGYGDITPASNGGKIFLAFYMLFSTVVTADVLGGAIDIYVNDYVGESIVRKIINSTTWVHKCGEFRNFCFQYLFRLFLLFSFSWSSSSLSICRHRLYGLC
jgi:potassium channel subfamily K